MSEKVRAVLGHLTLTGISFLLIGLEFINSLSFFAAFICFFVSIGLWAALGTKRSYWFSLFFAYGLWTIIGAIILYPIIAHDLAFPDRHLSDGDGPWVVLNYIFSVIAIGSGFFLGRIGISIVQSFAKTKSNQMPGPSFSDDHDSKL